MQKYFEGLDPEAIRFAIRQTIEHVALLALLSALVSIVIMQYAIGSVHNVGIIIAFVVPVILKTPSTLNMTLKNLQLSAANKKLKELASTDFLTGALNRRAFVEIVQGMLNHAAYDSDTPGALMVIDVDRFKQVNDTFGHDAGDMTLHMMIEKLREAAPDNAVIGRIGGEEFAVFFPRCDASHVATCTTRICKTISQTDFSAAGINIGVSVSAGVAMVTPGTTMRHLFRTADKLLYQAKDEGRNRVVFTSDADLPVENAA